jgi:hypothetical protein
MSNLRKSIFAKDPPKRAEPDPLDAIDPRSDSPDFLVPFHGLKFGINVWIPGHFRLTEEQAVLKAQNLLVELIYDTPEITPAKLGQHKIKLDDSGPVILRHTRTQQCVSIDAATPTAAWEVLGRAMRVLSALERRGDSRKIYSIMK